MLGEFGSYSQLDKPLAIPSALLEKVLGRSVNIQHLWDYGLSIKKDTFLVDEMQCTLPYELSAGYALSLASVGGAKSIGLVGFDGYDRDDIRQVRMNELLGLYNQKLLAPVVSLTPTTYHVTQSSVYAPKVQTPC